MSIATSLKSLLLVVSILFASVASGARPLTFAPDDTAEKKLAESLAAANTDEERQQLLNSEPELLNVKLREALTGIARSLRLKGDHTRALTVLEVARGVVEQIGDREGTAIVLGSIGDLHSMRGNHAQALSYYEKSVELSEALGDKAGLA